jgi:predicted metal-dependent phosphoesterase TrpH
VAADLHVHTTFSDSTLTPEEVIHECLWHGVDAVAITDHDSVEGVRRAEEAGAKVGIRVIPGAELTAYGDALEIHIVGLFVDMENVALAELLKRSRDERRVRVFEIVRRLSELGVEITAEEVFKIAGDGAPGRPHVARTLKDRGHVETIQDAFKLYIGNERPANVQKYKLTVLQAITAIHDAGGTSVVAHPGARLSDVTVRDLVKTGVDAIEAFHPLHSYTKEHKYLQMADDLGALVSGGSDSHGIAREWARIGVIKVAPEFVEQLEDRAMSRR